MSEARIKRPVKDKFGPGPVLGEYCKHEWMPTLVKKVQQCRICSELRMDPKQR